MAELPRNPGPDPMPGPGMPRWVKVFGIVALVLAVLVVIGLLTGGHGPSRHLSAGTPASVAAASVTGLGV